MMDTVALPEFEVDGTAIAPPYAWPRGMGSDHSHTEAQGLGAQLSTSEDRVTKCAPGATQPGLLSVMHPSLA